MRGIQEDHTQLAKATDRPQRIPSFVRVTGIAICLLMFFVVAGPSLRQERRVQATSSHSNYPIQFDSLDATLHLGIGFLQQEWLHQPEAALNSYNHALALQPDYAVVYNCRGLAHSSLGQSESAQLDYTRAIELYPEGYFGYYNRGRLHLDRNELESALADFNNALSVEPQGIWAIQYRAVTYDALGDYEQAVRDFKLYLDMQLANEAWSDYAERRIAETYYYPAVEAKSEDSLTTALAQLADEHVHHPKNEWAIIYRAMTYQALGNHEQALADFRLYLDLQPTDRAWADFAQESIAGTYYYRAIQDQSEDSLLTALTQLDAELVNNPTNEWAAVNRAMTYEALGDYERAISDYKRFLELQPTDDAWIVYAQRSIAGAYYYQAMQSESEDDLLTALAHLEDELASDPENGWATMYRAMTYDSLGDYEHAISDYKRFLILLPAEEAWGDYAHDRIEGLSNTTSLSPF